MALYLIRPLADRHLDEQAFHIATHSGLEMGHRFYDDAERTFQRLAINPGLGKRTNYQNHLLKDSRVFRMQRFNKHLIFYRPLPKEGIEIIDILHGARDIKNLY